MDSVVAQVRSGVDIVGLIGEHLSLKKAGRTFKALCPFHAEKTPSFVIFPDTGRWHCFGCGEGGDVFSFMMKIENLTFAEALRRLADRIGVVVTQTREPEETKEARARLYAANEAAAVFYHGLLINAPTVREYVRRRGINEDTVREFLLGFAPDAAEALHRQLLTQGFSNDELLRAGLLFEPESGPVRDRYRGRLLFPIRDGDGHVVSFGGRALSSDQQPKYLNGPQTEIFDKGSTLFALQTATPAIRKERRAVIVEGYVDVVVAHQADFRNVVATLGTSVTDRHLRQLARLAPEICLALDADAAGERAALRTADVAREALLDAAMPIPSVKETWAGSETWRGPSGARWRPLVRYEATSRSALVVATLPDGMDPDELILQDPEAWRQVISAARPIVAHAIDSVATRADLSSARGKADAAEILLPLLSDVADPVQRAHYIEVAGQALHVDATALAERLRSGRSSRPRRGAATSLTNVPSRPAQLDTYDQHDYAIALAVAASQRGLPEIRLDPDDFSDPGARALVMYLDDVQKSSVGRQWRPDLLHLVADAWLEGPVARVRDALADIERLTDAQIAVAARSMNRQLRDARLAMELPELATLAQESDPEDLQQIKARIVQINRERALIHREDAAEPRGPAALGSRTALVPAQFRAQAPDRGHAISQSPPEGPPDRIVG